MIVKKNQKCISNMFVMSNTTQFYALTASSKFILAKEFAVLTSFWVDDTIRPHAEEGQIQREGRRVAEASGRGFTARDQLSHHQAMDLQEEDSQHSNSRRTSPDSGK